MKKEQSLHSQAWWWNNFDCNCIYLHYTPVGKNHQRKQTKIKQQNKKSPSVSLAFPPLLIDNLNANIFVLKAAKLQIFLLCTHVEEYLQSSPVLELSEAKTFFSVATRSFLDAWE